MKQFLPLAFLFIFSAIIAQRPSLVLPQSHGGRINSALFGNKNKYIVTAGEDGTARLWDYASGRLIRVYAQPGSSVKATLSQDETVLAIYGNKVEVYNIKKDSLVFKEENENPGFLTVSPDNKYLAAITYGHCKIWSLESKKLLKEFPHAGSETKFAQFTKDSRHILIPYYKIYSPPSLKIESLFPNDTSKRQQTHWETGDKIELATFSPDENYVAAITTYPYKFFLLSIKDNKIIVSDKITSADAKIAFDIKNEFVFVLDNKKLTAWDIKAGKVHGIFNIPGVDNSLNEVSCNILPEDNSLLITFGSSIFLIDPVKMTPIKSMVLPEFLVNNSTIDKTGSFILVTSYEGASVYYTSSLTKRFSLGASSGIFEFCETGRSEFLAGLSDGSAGLWNYRDGKNLARIRMNEGPIYMTRHSQDKKLFLIGGGNKLSVFDAKLKTKYFTLDEHSTEIVNASFNIDDSKILTSSQDGLFILWSSKTGKKIRAVKPAKESSSWGAYFLDSSRLVAAHSYDEKSDADRWNIFDAESAGLIAELTPAKLGLHGFSFSTMFDFSPTSPYVVSLMQEGLSGGFAAVINIRKGTIEKRISQGNISAIQFSPSGRFLIVSSEDGTVTLWSCPDFRKVKEFSSNSHEITAKGVVFSSAEEKVAILLSSNKIIICKTIEDKSSEIIELPATESMGCLFINNDSLLLINTADNLNIIWDIFKKKELYSFALFKEGDYISILPSGVFMMPRDVLKQIRFRIKNTLVASEQFDIKYNRPDIVLEAIGNTDTALISAYRSAYIQRINRLKIDTTRFMNDYSVPVLDFNDRDSIDYNQTNGLLSLDIHSKGDNYSLERFNAWVNEVPLYGINGISLKGRNKKDFDTTITVSLTNGENRIEASVFDENATESYRSPLLVNYTNPDTSKTKTFFIGIGVNKYKNHPRPRNLSFAKKDISDLDSIFKKNSPYTSYILTDSNATRENILKLKEKLMKTNINDKVIIALSGHGALYERKDFYFGTYDIDFDKPYEKGLKYEELESLLNDIPARKKLLLIDACHSGEVDTSGINNALAEEYKKLPATDSKDTTQGKKNDPENDIKSSSVGLDNSFELMKELFADLSRGNGAVVISAARGSGYAEENPVWQNGAFTLCLKAAISGNKLFPELLKSADLNGDGVSINELKEYILTNVPRITNERQKPTTRRENIEVDWKLW